MHEELTTMDYRDRTNFAWLPMELAHKSASGIFSKITGNKIDFYFQENEYILNSVKSVCLCITILFSWG